MNICIKILQHLLDSFLKYNFTFYQGVQKVVGNKKFFDDQKRRIWVPVLIQEVRRISGYLVWWYCILSKAYLLATDKGINIAHPSVKDFRVPIEPPRYVPCYSPPPPPFRLIFELDSLTLLNWDIFCNTKRQQGSNSVLHSLTFIFTSDLN